MKPTFYYTDNQISHVIADAMGESGYPVAHIKDFEANPSIFYGILRGSGMAMNYLKRRNIDYWYIDNGYYDAQYVDAHMLKNLDGKYRVVKNGLIDVYNGAPVETSYLPSGYTFLLLPPSPYSAFMHDDTPEDWLARSIQKITNLNCKYIIRKKGDAASLRDDMNKCDIVYAFNSMSIMEAIRCNKFVFDTHGILRNDKTLSDLKKYSYDELVLYFKDKNHTLGEIATCLKFS